MKEKNMTYTVFYFYYDIFIPKYTVLLFMKTRVVKITVVNLMLI